MLLTLNLLYQWDAYLRLKPPRHSLRHLSQHQPTRPFTPLKDENNRWTVLELLLPPPQRGAGVEVGASLSGVADM